MKSLEENIGYTFKNKELLNLFDKYDRGELKDEDLSFDTSKYINNTIDKEI